MEIHLVIPGEPVVKKNTAKTSMFFVAQNGRKIAREHPVHYYTPAYKDWAAKAIIACSNYKVMNPNMQPITYQLNMKCLFFLGSMRSVDLSGLYEGIQDVMAGNSGLPNPPSYTYQLIADDNYKIIGAHDGSRVLLDLVEPRTEVWLTKLNL